MSSDDGHGRTTDADLADTVATARDLIGRLAGDPALRTGTGDAAALLRQAQGALSRLAPRPAAPAAAATADVDPATTMMLDVSDLLGYFEHNRRPTGIQRVQAELILNIVTADDRTAGLCYFVEDRDRWVAIDPARFADLCALSDLDFHRDRSLETGAG